MRNNAQELTRSRKRKKTFPVQTICRNCGTQQISRYCHNCGQDIFSGSERSLKEISGNFLDTVLAWDNKILITLKYLVFYPGKLTKEFFAGRIASYVFPAKLFWFMSILFFATISIDNKAVLRKPDLNEIIEVVQDNISAETMKVADKDAVGEEIEEIFSNRIKNKEINQLFIGYAPYAMFFLIPVFALLIQAFFYRKCRYYASQMIFSLHFHSFIFLALAIINTTTLFYPGFADTDIHILVFLIISTIYFCSSLYVVYSPKKRHLLWKMPVITFIYVIALLVAIVLLAIITGIIIYGFDVLKEIEMFD